MSIHSHIDVAKPGLVEGWLINKEKPGHRCAVAAIHKGRVIAEVKADILREDLAGHGVGDGRHAFRLPVPARLSGGGYLEIVDKETGTPLIGSPIQVEDSAAVTPAADTPPLLIDLSDMIFYLEHHDHLSGIQRVQANVLKAIVEEALFPLNRIRVVYYKEGEQAFYEMPLSFVTSLIEDTGRELGSRQFKRRADGRLHLEDEAKVEPLALDEEEAENSVLLMLGAAWVFPSYFYAVRQLKRRGTRFVPLLHDLIPVVMPTMCDKGTAEVFKIFIRRAVWNADYILTVSEHTRRDLIAYCEENGLECPPTAVSKNGQSLGVLSKRREAPPVQGDYVLFVSTIEGRKNHRMALQIWERLMRVYGDDVPSLVFVGRLGWRVEGLVEKLHEKNFLNQKVVILSEVSDRTLAGLYENCLFTIYPSLYEGWGLPVGESLAFGKVCLASNASSIPEVGGDLAVYFDPANLDDAVNKADQLIRHPERRTDLERAIREQFRPISWTEAAANAIKGVEQAAATPAKAMAPLLEVGEYNFARISYLESNVVHGDEVARHLRDFSEPRLMFKRLTLDSYILAEECLTEGTWFAPEAFGRWGHKNGSILRFRVPDADKAYLAYLQVQVPEPYVKAQLELSFQGRVVDFRSISQGKATLRLDLSRYSQNGEASISIRLGNEPPMHVDGDPRLLGVGLCRLALVERENVHQRLEIMERTMFY
jgi:glycosyltransferase involved in cell wall biosynthesis